MVSPHGAIDFSIFFYTIPETRLMSMLTVCVPRERLALSIDSVTSTMQGTTLRDHSLDTFVQRCLDHAAHHLQNHFEFRDRHYLKVGPSNA